MKKAIPKIATLYRGVFGAASGAGIAIGAYFAFYGAATNVLVRKTDMQPGSIAFVAGAIAAAGGSVVKVPLAVCIRSVQAGVYPNAFKAATEITRAAGPFPANSQRNTSPMLMFPGFTCAQICQRTFCSQESQMVGGASVLLY